MSEDNNATYLGDGAYVRDGSYPGEMILYCTDGKLEYATIHLGPTEVVALLQFITRKTAAERG